MYTHTRALRSRVLSPLSTCWTQASCRQRTMRSVPVLGRSWMLADTWAASTMETAPLRFNVPSAMYAVGLWSLSQTELWWWRWSDTNSLADRSSSQVLNHCHTDSLTVDDRCPLLGGPSPPGGHSRLQAITAEKQKKLLTLFLILSHNLTSLCQLFYFTFMLWYSQGTIMPGGRNALPDPL